VAGAFGNIREDPDEYPDGRRSARRHDEAAIVAEPVEGATVHVRTLASASAAVVVTLLLAACTSSSPPHPVAAATTTVAGATAGLTAGTVHFVDYAINTDGPASSAILTGAVGDFGTGERVKPDGSADPDHTGLLKLTLKHGTFRLDIGTLDAHLVSAYRAFPADPHTCSGSVTVHAPVPIVADSGTGAYAHLRGTFDLAATVDEVDTPPCDGTGAFIAQTIIISGTGAVTGY
jgi:hypothetical protein